MQGNYPSNFGEPQPTTDFTQPGGPGPGQLWDPERPTKRYNGTVFFTGGSNPGYTGPWSEYRMGEPDNSAFWSRAADQQPKPGYNFGLGGGNR